MGGGGDKTKITTGHNLTTTLKLQRNKQINENKREYREKWED